MYVVDSTQHSAHTGTTRGMYVVDSTQHTQLTGTTRGMYVVDNTHHTVDSDHQRYVCGGQHNTQPSQGPAEVCTWWTAHNTQLTGTTRGIMIVYVCLQLCLSPLSMSHVPGGQPAHSCVSDFNSTRHFPRTAHPVPSLQVFDCDCGITDASLKTQPITARQICCPYVACPLQTNRRDNPGKS